MRQKPSAVLLLTVLVIALSLIACMPGPNPLGETPTANHGVAGFWLGLWHGIIIWVSFIVSLFNPSVSVYEVHNSGWAYDLGFAIGAATLHGGGASAARRRRRAAE